MDVETNLDKVLEAIASPVRLQMLQTLAKQDLPYSELCKAVGMNKQRDAGKFSYHLKKLIIANLIKVNEKTKFYELSSEGREVLELVNEIESKIIAPHEIVVRKMDGTVENFDKSKIILSLVKEGGLPSKLAHSIANIVDEKIKNLKISFLTSTTIRDITNFILMEQGYDKYRNRLIRIGIPVSDFNQAIKEAHKKGGTNYLMKLCSDYVMKEWALLNLPRHVSDAHLSGFIELDSLENWPTKIYGIIYFESVKNSLKLMDGLLDKGDKVWKEICLAGEDLTEINLKQFVNDFLRRMLKASFLQKIDFTFLINQIDDKELQSIIKEILKLELNKRLKLLIKPSGDNKLENIISDREVEVRLIVGNEMSFFADGFQAKRVPNTNLSELWGASYINMSRLCFESKGDESKLTSMIRDILEKVASAFYKKISLISQVQGTFGEKDRRPNFIISPVGCFEAVRIMTGSYPDQDEGSFTLLKTILKYMWETAKKIAKGRVDMKLASYAPIKAAKRMARLDLWTYGLRTVSTKMLSYDPSNPRYSNYVIPPERKMDMDSRIKMIKDLSNLLAGGSLIAVPITSSPHGKSGGETLDLLNKLMNDAGNAVLKFER